jgi:hypothetical protein
VSLTAIREEVDASPREVAEEVLGRGPGSEEPREAGKPVVFRGEGL